MQALTDFSNKENVHYNKKKIINRSLNEESKNEIIKLKKQLERRKEMIKILERKCGKGILQTTKTLKNKKKELQEKTQEQDEQIYLLKQKLIIMEEYLQDCQVENAHLKKALEVSKNQLRRKKNNDYKNLHESRQIERKSKEDLDLEKKNISQKKKSSENGYNTSQSLGRQQIQQNYLQILQVFHIKINEKNCHKKLMEEIYQLKNNMQSLFSEVQQRGKNLEILHGDNVILQSWLETEELENDDLLQKNAKNTVLLDIAKEELALSKKMRQKRILSH